MNKISELLKNDHKIRAGTKGEGGIIPWINMPLIDLHRVSKKTVPVLFCE